MVKPREKSSLRKRKVILSEMKLIICLTINTHRVYVYRPIHAHHRRQEQTLFACKARMEMGSGIITPGLMVVSSFTPTQGRDLEKLGGSSIKPLHGFNRYMLGGAGGDVDSMVACCADF